MRNHRMSFAAGVLGVAAVSCRVILPETQFECSEDRDCPPKQLCDQERGLCSVQVADASDAADAGAEVWEDLVDARAGAAAEVSPAAGRGGTPAGKGAAGKGAAGAQAGRPGAAGARAAGSGGAGGTPAQRAGAGGGAGSAGAATPAGRAAPGQAGGAGGSPLMAAGAPAQAPTCDEGYADCNGDLHAGSSGDACETHVREDPNHCGDCRTRCRASATALAACDNGRCTQVRPITGKVTAVGPEHGVGEGGITAYEVACKQDSVLVGLDVITDPSSRVLYGFRLACAPLRLAVGSQSDVILSHGDVELSATVGYDPNQEPAVWRQLRCPTHALVTSVFGVYGNVTIGGGSFTTITQLALACEVPHANAARELSFDQPTGLYSATSEQRVTDYAFSEACSGGAVFGFRGKYGGALDKLQTHCAELGVSYEGAMAETQ